MQNEQQFSDKITIGGRPDTAEIEKLHARGFKTIINLMTPDEPGFAGEELAVENTGMTYSSIPIAPKLLDEAAMARFSQAIESSDGPVAVHCKSGGRAGVLSLLHLAVSHGWNRETALREAQEMGVKIGPESPYRAFFESYIGRHSAGERGDY